MTSKPNKEARPLASQTLLRGMEIIDAVANGHVTLLQISERTGLNSSTAHRIASALVQVRYLRFEARKGYSLGAKLMELGFQAYHQSDLPSRARIHLEKLAEFSRDTVHLAVMEGQEVVYLDKIAGQRPVEISSRIGGRKPVCTTGVGKALLLDSSEEHWRSQYKHDMVSIEKVMSEGQWLTLMYKYAKAGYALDLGEDHILIRCVAAPVYDGYGKIVAAISVSSAVEYMSNERLDQLVPVVLHAAEDISSELGARARNIERRHA